MITVKQFLAVCVAIGSVFAVVAKDAPFKKMDIKVELTAAPDVAYRNHNTFSPKVPSANKWLMVKVEYTPTAQNEFSPVVRRSGKSGLQVSFPGWFDDVELKVQIVYDTGVTVRKIPVRVFFSGGCRFHSIKADGKTHLALMFIPARLLDRYCSNWGGTSKPGKDSFYVKAEMLYGGRVLGVVYSSNLSGKDNIEKDRKFEKMCNRIPERLKLENSVLPRSRSPWALLAPDNFDLEIDKKVGAAQE